MRASGCADTDDVSVVTQPPQVGRLGRWQCFAHVGRFLNGSAWFEVWPGIATVRTVGLLGTIARLQAVEKRGGEVLVVRTRRPFWGSTLVYLDPEVHVAVGSWATTRVLDSLRKAGFAVIEERANFVVRKPINLSGLVTRIRHHPFRDNA